MKRYYPNEELMPNQPPKRLFLWNPNYDTDPWVEPGDSGGPAVVCWVRLCVEFVLSIF